MHPIKHRGEVRKLFWSGLEVFSKSRHYEKISFNKKNKGKIHKPFLRFKLMIETTKTFRKYLVCPINTNSFREKYTNSNKYCLCLTEELDIFE